LILLKAAENCREFMAPAHELITAAKPEPAPVMFRLESSSIVPLFSIINFY